MNAIYKLLDDDRALMHPMPRAGVVSRGDFVGRFKGKRVLDIGSSGSMGEYIKSIAQATTVCRKDADYCLDIEKDDLPDGEFDYVFCGEIIEHLSNAGVFLDKLKKYRCPIVITVPNAFSSTARYHALQGMENVNGEHTCWYSYTTMRGLLERHGYMVHEFHWYNGKPYTAEGLIFVVGRR